MKEHYGFGDWIAYKVADMLERCCGVPVVFSHEDAMYDSPTQAAIRVWREKQGLSEAAKPKEPARAVRAVVDHLLDLFGPYEAPGGGRTVGLQEVETVLCKWQSHQNGHYPLDNDLIEIRHGALPWADHSPTARQFLQHLPLTYQR